MKLLFLEFWDKVRRKYLLPIYIFQIAFLFFYSLVIAPAAEVGFVQHLQLSQKASVVVFVCSIFLGYEIFCDIQNKAWREVMGVEKNSIAKVFFAKNLLSILMLLILFAAALALELSQLNRAGAASVAGLTAHVWRVQFINYALLPLLGMIIGKAFGVLCKKRWTGYMAIVIVVLCTCGVFQKISMGLYDTVGINLDNIVHFVQVIQPNMTWIADYVYLIPVENYRICLLLFWMVVFEGSVWIYYLKKKILKYVSAAAAVVLCVCFTVQVVDAGNYMDFDLNYANAASKKSEFEKDNLPAEQEADFSASHYAMDVTFGKELEADVTITLKETGLQAYRFTLYRGYQLTSVTDEKDQALDFDREQDYITVYSKDEIQEIHMSYHGYNQSFYSNTFGVLLPGYFAYYPQAGWRQVFLNQTENGVVSYGYNSFPEGLQESEYEISIHGFGKTVYSNLDGKENHFQGTTAAPLLMAGAVSEKQNGNLSYIYPSTMGDINFSMEETLKKLETYAAYLNVDVSEFSDITHIIYMPVSAYMDNAYGSCVCTDRCLMLGTDVNVTNAEELAFTILKQKINAQGEKTFLADVVIAFLADSDYTQSLETMDRDTFLATEIDIDDEESTALFDGTLDRMYATLLETYGEETAAQRCMAYLVDEEAEESVAEFMKKLYLDLEGGK